jgi:high-affinity nickel permease
MISFLSIVALGLVLGMRHATDPDHVVAVTTIVSRQRSLRAAALIGTLWGIGHTITMLLVGGAIVLLGWAMPARLGLWMEFAVALMLVLLGALNLTGILQWFTDKVSPAEHRKLTAGAQHLHTHCAATDRLFGKMGCYQTLRPFIVGIVHGLAGSAAITLLVLATIRNPRWAMAYLLVFGGGTILGMILITAAIAAPFTYVNRLSRKTNSGFQFASGVISLGFGLFLAYHIVFVSGLFTGHPQWTPH